MLTLCFGRFKTSASMDVALFRPALKSTRLSLSIRQGLQCLFRGDGAFLYLHVQGVIDGIGHRAHGLAGFLENAAFRIN